MEIHSSDIVRYQTNLSTICVAPGCRIIRSILVSEGRRRQSQLVVQPLDCPSLSRSRFLFVCLFLSFCLMANDRQRNKYKQTMHGGQYKLFVYTIYKDNSNTAKKMHRHLNTCACVMIYALHKYIDTCMRTYFRNDASGLLLLGL